MKQLMNIAKSLKKKEETEFFVCCWRETFGKLKIG